VKLTGLICVSLLLAACQQAPMVEQASPLASRGLAFAQSSCGGCHSVDRNGRSSSGAPSFSVIVNQEGVTVETLSTWLRGAHNYPQEMDFYLQEAQVDALVAHLLTLKDPNFRRPPD
jgi:mono/diheme cytochrome c family protein